MKKIEKKSTELGLSFNEIQHVLSEDALSSMEMNELYGGLAARENHTNCKNCIRCKNCEGNCNTKNVACDNTLGKLPSDNPIAADSFLPIIGTLFGL